MVQKEKIINVMQCRSTYTTGGGPDKTVLLIAEKANPAVFRNVLVYMRGADDTKFKITQWAQEKGLTIHEVLEYKKLDFSNLKQIHQLIRQYDIDILHARDYKTCFIGYLLSKVNRRLKLVFTAHGWVVDSTKMKLYTWLNFHSLKAYCKIIAVSEATRQLMVKAGIDARKIVVVHNAIDVDSWRRDITSSTIREELNIPTTAKIVGVVGRLRYEKDIMTTLKVARQVIQKRPETHFLIIGDGPDREKAEQTAHEMELSHKIHFPGFRKDVNDIYAEMDLFASTSLTEGTPNTVLEAFAMEVPVVHTAVGGVPELIEDGRDGILCNVRDVQGISEAILSLLNNETKAQQFRKYGRQKACTEFSFTNRLKKIEAIYKEVADA